MKSLAVLLVGLATLAVQAQPLPEVRDSGLGYPSPQAALKALRAKPGVTERHENNWTVLYDKSENSFWSIAEEGNPAYPSVVRRKLVQTPTGIELKMGVICGASKEACDGMVRLFQEGNEAMQEDIARMPKGHGQ